MGKTVRPMSGSPPSVTVAQAADVPEIFGVWESSVRATHTFLTESDIQFLIPIVRQAFAQCSPLHCTRDVRGRISAFLFVADGKIEMLFVHADRRGEGLGTLLTTYAIGVLGADLVDVNEQNEQAVGFYEHLGFRRFDRSPLDPTGKPFPILHMKLQRIDREQSE